MLDKFKQNYNRKLGPENRPWVRGIDTFMVLMLMFSMVTMLFVLPTPEKPLVVYLLLFALICSAVLALTLYRQTDLHRLERLAVLCLILCVSLTLMISMIELGVKK